jgi:hypothetical protein
MPLLRTGLGEKLKSTPGLRSLGPVAVTQAPKTLTAMPHVAKTTSNVLLLSFAACQPLLQLLLPHRCCC